MIFAHLGRIIAIIWRNGGRYWSLGYYLATIAILHKSDVARFIVAVHPRGGWRLVRTLFAMSPVWAVVPITILIGVAFYREILSLERSIRQHLVLSTSPREKCLVTARHEQDASGAMAKLLRLQVINPSSIPIKGCRAYLLEVERLGEAGHVTPVDYGDSLPLRWSTRESESEIDLPGDVPQYVNLLFAVEGENRLRLLRDAVPHRYQDLFEAVGRYRLRVAVSAEGIATGTAQVDVEWTGHWDGLDLAAAEPTGPEATREFWRRLWHKVPA
jgi:hypothetical protein